MKSPVILRIFKGTELIEVKQFSSSQIIFGNGGEVQVLLADSTVSPIHCLIEMRDNGFYVCDLGSSTGTYKNKNIVLDEPISSGDQIGIGAYTVHFFVGVPKPTEPPSPAASVNQPPPVKKQEPKAPPAPTPTIPTLKQSEFKPTANSVKQPSVGGGKSSYKKDKKLRKTFAPPSEIKDLKSYLKPTKGPTLEVLVAWQERILSVSHFNSGKNVTIGSTADCDVQVPDHVVKNKALFIDTSSTTRVSLNGSMMPEMITAEKKLDTDELVALGKAVKGGNGSMVRVDQGEILAITVGDGSVQIFVRHVPTPRAPALAGLDLTAGELTAIVVSMVIVSLLALYMSVYAPAENAEEKKEEQLRLAQFVFNKKETKVEREVTPPPPKEEPPKPPVKIEVGEKKDTQGDPKKPVAVKDKPAAKAAEVRPNPSNKNKPKKFTSTKQGGAVKTTDKEGANAQSNRDVTKTGLLSAFNSGGSRDKLDKAYSGSGELLGMAGQATGTSGQATDREGNDIGSKFKDTGAGGKGTSTQGISGIGTKGRSSGQSEYGELGSGGKGSTAIEVGGSGAEFVGTVDREAVRRVVRSIYNQIKNCYERQLRSQSDIEGKIVIHWEVVDQGRVKLSNVKEAASSLKGVAECVALRIRDQKFPEPPQGSYYEVDYPFVMGKQK